jgi:hypothetical protein
MLTNIVDFVMFPVDFVDFKDGDITIEETRSKSIKKCTIENALRVKTKRSLRFTLKIEMTFLERGRLLRLKYFSLQFQKSSACLKAIIK